jgi:hypothetical protein
LINKFAGSLCVVGLALVGAQANALTLADLEAATAASPITIPGTDKAIYGAGGSTFVASGSGATIEVTDPSAVPLTFPGGDAVQFGLNGKVTAPGSFVDYSIDFFVEVTSGPQKISEVDAFTNLAGTGTGSGQNSESIIHGTTVVGTLLTDNANQSDAAILAGAFTSVEVTKDIQLTAGPDGTETLSIVRQSFIQTGNVPEPGVVAMFVGMGMSGAVALRRRRK